MDPFIGNFECFTYMSETIVYCNTCNQNVNFRDKPRLKQHLTTNNHIQNLTGTSNHSFYEDLCESFISAIIPLKKLNNPSLPKFLAKCTKQNIPDESTIRKYRKYVPKQYEKVMMTIKSQIKDKYVWFTVDETTDIQGRRVVNIIVGTLFSQQPSEQFLISSTFHNTVKAEKLCEKIIKALQHNYE
jgi:hypothetical protein